MQDRPQNLYFYLYVSVEFITYFVVPVQLGFGIRNITFDNQPVMTYFSYNNNKKKGKDPHLG